MVKTSMDLLTWLRKQLEEADLDLLRAMVNEFAVALMGAEVDDRTFLEERYELFRRAG